MARNKQQKQQHNENVQQASGVDDTQNLTQDGAEQAPALTEETSAVEQADGASDTIGDPAASDDDATE